MWSKPISKANSRALLEDKTSTLITMDGRGTCCDNEAMARPSLFFMTIPYPTVLSWIKIAPLKFILYQWGLGGDREVVGWLWWIEGVEGLERDSGPHFWECSSTLSRGRKYFPSWILLRRFHGAQMTEENNSDSLLPAKMKSIMSMKVELCLSALWFHIGVWFQRVSCTG